MPSSMPVCDMRIMTDTVDAIYHAATADASDDEKRGEKSNVAL